MTTHQTARALLRRLTATAAGIALTSMLGLATAEAASCANPTQMDGFKTCANVAKAEQEGEVVFYTTDPPQGTTEMLDAFMKAFPKIKATFVRLQAGNLFAKLMAERQAKNYLVDVMAISEMTFAADLQKRNGWAQYVSPEAPAYRTEFQSQPQGYWTWGSLIIAGIAYNPKLVPADQLPKSWNDVFNPLFTGAINTKLSTSGLQHESWYKLRQMFGEEYWTKFAALQPRGFDSYVQQFDRMVNGQDKIVHTAQYSGYLQVKAKGAQLGFIFPTEGLVTGPQIYGLIADGPHPEAAKLFLDWFLGKPGQIAMQNGHFLSSPRTDTPPPPGGIATSDMKLLLVDDWDAYMKSRPQFVREWDKMMGLR
jgi:iron(III) transport system substrate-binding protein